MSRRDGSETGRNIIKFNVLVYGPRSPAITSPRYLLGNREAILYADPNHPLPLHSSLLHPPRSTFAVVPPLFRTRPFCRSDFRLHLPVNRRGFFFSRQIFARVESGSATRSKTIVETIEKLLPDGIKVVRSVGFSWRWWRLGTKLWRMDSRGHLLNWDVEIVNETTVKPIDISKLLSIRHFENTVINQSVVSLNRETRVVKNVNLGMARILTSAWSENYQA